ncbi:GNAT family N-acetyltransferase [Streptomyces sp. P9(2023)]|uniref:GNAT family N-acetyltransferase n=1 Tax=Streptomyces sp. P9(2023) TaxID=3064394 RepID=UPI0028F3E439|nr:GNAT family N-acetyltransferase [Streptomyces sp. P9(2023)]MDT9688116.1 GNAT family N-acetyltransferase [Streptomyces sp. P9(2023)]
MDTASITSAWVAGWTVARGTSPAVVEPWGWRIDVGLPTHVFRHVLPAPDAVSVGKLCAEITVPGAWLKVMAGPEEVAEWITPGWTVPDDPGYMMSKTLDPGTRPPAPEGYARTTETRDGVIRVRIVAPDGTLAAWGRIAPTGATAVADQIETHAGHRRRGLGSNVMRTLEAAAAQAGATTGVLFATRDGLALYDSLDWRYECPLTGIVREA